MNASNKLYLSVCQSNCTLYIQIVPPRGQASMSNAQLAERKARSMSHTPPPLATLPHPPGGLLLIGVYVPGRSSSMF